MSLAAPAPSPSNHGVVGAEAPVTGRLVSERISKVGICVCVCVRWGKGTLPISQNWLCFAGSSGRKRALLSPWGFLSCLGPFAAVKAFEGAH